MLRPSDMRRVVDEALQHAVETLQAAGEHDEALRLQKTQIVWSERMHRSAGSARANKGGTYQKVTISQRLFDKSQDLAELRETVLHEFAHVLTVGHGHDLTWHFKCLQLGGNGEEKHHMGSVPRAFKNPSVPVFCDACAFRGELGPTQAKKIRQGKAKYRHRGCRRFPSGFLQISKIIPLRPADLVVSCARSSSTTQGEQP